MPIDRDTVKHIAKLARISLDEKKINSLSKDLSSIMEFIGKLNELNTENIEATFSTLNNPTPLREDNPVKTDIIKEVLAHAPKAKDGYFIVPKIIE